MIMTELVTQPWINQVNVRNRFQMISLRVLLIQVSVFKIISNTLFFQESLNNDQLQGMTLSNVLGINCETNDGVFYK